MVTSAGETLKETVAILLTLAERHPAVALLPASGAPERAQALRWLLFIATEIYSLVETNDYPEHYAPSPDSASAVHENARQKWRERWLLVEASVSGDTYFLPTQLRLVDNYIAGVSRWAQQDEWWPNG